MKARYQATRAAIDLIKRFEGFRARAAQLADGRWTIGYGHTKSARAGAVISEADADTLLIYDVAAVTAAINQWVFSPLNQNQFDALTAFVFNIGLPNFRRSSVLRRLNEGSYLQAACAMEMWRTADFEGERIVVDALVRRRSAEMALFLTPMEGHIPVPSLIVVPRVDEQAARSAPMRATEVETPLDTAIAAAVRAEDAEPASAAMAAAAAITARLNALLHDDAPAAKAESQAPEPQAPELETAEAAPIVGAPLPPVEDLPVAAAPSVPERLAEEPASDEPVAAAAAERHDEDDAVDGLRPTVEPPPPLMYRAPSTLPFARRRKKAPAPMLVLMGLTGLGVAGAGPFWGFSANIPGHSPIMPDAEIAGMGLGLAGAGLLAASIYMLLTRLAGQSE
ncbi:MAG: glycoside hydrolase family protein [Caulobacteraceae bacterium]